MKCRGNVVSKHDSAKTHAKKLARRKRIVAKQRWRQELERRHGFPAFVVQPNEAPPVFVDAIRRAVHNIDFRDKSQFSDNERLIYRHIKEAGVGHTLSEQLQAALAANLADPQESDIRARLTGLASNGPTDAGLTTLQKEFWGVLAALVLPLLLFEWFWFHRRV